MYLVTNRQLYRDSSGVDVLGPEAYHEDATRLRMVEATRRGERWSVKVLPDRLTDAMKREVGISEGGDVFASRYVMEKIRRRLRRRKQHLLFFIHGYNNDMEDVLKRAAKLEKNYKMTVLTFTWPARGGGIRGTLSYRSDKSAAEESTPALERVLERFGGYVREIEDEREQRLIKRMSPETAENGEARDRSIIEATEKECPFRISMMAHSMGCYLVRKVYADFTPPPDLSFFDNVVLAAPDANNPGHGEWVRQLNPRQGVYITLNQHDAALGLSERKFGRKQLARLGRLARNYEAPEAVYVNFTGARGVRHLPEAHAYFEGKVIESNARIRQFFRAAFHGAIPEEKLKAGELANVYSIT